MISWLSFEWKTSGVSEVGEALAPLLIRPARKDDEEVVKKAVLSAFSMDPAWGDVTRALTEKFGTLIGTAFEAAEPPCVVLLHGSRIIGASHMDVAIEASNHLVTGPCVLHEYRNRGLGSALLQASLVFLREHGVSTARGITRGNSISARFVYPKFGGRSHPLETDPIKTREA